MIVPEELAGQRLDIVVARLAPGVSRRHARRLVDDGAVFVDGKRVQVCSRPVRAGARLEVSVGTDQAPRALIPVRLVALDDDLCVADKAAGVPTEPTREGASGTLKAGLEAHLKELGQDVTFLHAAHRLDTDTTGVVIFARSSNAAHVVGRQLHDGTAERRYLAVVDGVPTWTRARLDWSLARQRDERGRIHVDADGVPAITLATVLARGTRGALVWCAPRTGRTHQLRVHLAEAGHALAGDRRYGRNSPVRERPPHLGLHALSLTIAHPRDGRVVTYAAAPPPAFLETAARFAGVSERAVVDVVARLCGGQVAA